MWGTAVWAVRDGPAGPRVSERDNELFLKTSFEGLLTDLLNLRLFATIAVSSMNVIKLLQSGREICTVMIYPLVDNSLVS